jgi:HD-GYP domain-containing protein (c-di-GMP phosphodiesterase class II)
MKTSNLSIGMFVGMLDRPWLETPFVFQGFLIKDRYEIEQLESYCSQVYVEIERGKLTEAQIRAMAAGAGPMPGYDGRQRPRKLPGWLHRFVVKTGLAQFLAARRKKRTEAYEITSTVRREAPLARKAYERAVKSHQRIFRRARSTGCVDIERVIQAVSPLIQSILRNPNAMAWTVFSGKRSGRNYSRAVATAVWAIMFGRHLGFDRKILQDLAIGGLLLDIGNVDLPEALLNTTGAFTHEEFEDVPHHVQAGIDILSRSSNVEPAVFEMIMYHHDRHDGSGYPHEIQGSNIPPMGRIAGIVDCYDAMTTKRLACFPPEAWWN